MTFGEKIILVRKQLKWSQDELAKKIGTSAPIIGRYEREEIKPFIEVASKLADALNVTLDYLLGKSDNMTLYKKNCNVCRILNNSPKKIKKIFSTLLTILLKLLNLKILQRCK